MIGLIFTEMYVNTFYMELFHGIEKTLNSFGYKLIVSTTGDNPERECQIILELKEKNVDGIIMTLSTVNRTLSADNILKDLSRENFPIVFIDRKFSGFSIDYVGSNNEEGGYIATRYLLNLGHKRIGFILGVVVIQVRGNIVDTKGLCLNLIFL